MEITAEREAKRFHNRYSQTAANNEKGIVGFWSDRRGEWTARAVSLTDKQSTAAGAWSEKWVKGYGFSGEGEFVREGWLPET
ncbi:hypothetical protein GQ457_05G025450 [Hibiscus cannabinus]